jgi:hypothetical protein
MKNVKLAFLGGLLLAVWGLPFASPAFAVDPVDQILIKEGDVVPGVGLVTSIWNKSVDNDGNTVVQVETDNPDYNLDHAVLVNGVLQLMEGQAMALPAGSTLDEFNTMTINTSLNHAWWFDLDGTSGPVDDAALYFGTNMLLQQGFPSTAPTFGVGNYINFFAQSLLNEQDHILVIMSVNDPLMPITTDWAIVLMTVDATGNLESETVLFREQEKMPGQPNAARNLEIRTQCFAFNDLDQFMVTLDEDYTGEAIYVDYTLVARQDQPSPVAGRNWKYLDGAEIDLNNVGGWVIHAELDGDNETDFLIEKSGEKLVQEGDSLPGIEGYKFTRFGMGPVEISDTDNVLWYGDWDDPDITKDNGLFLNEHLILKNGLSKVEGQLIERIHGVEFGYRMSPNGEWIIVEAQLEGDVNSVMLLHIGPWTYLGKGLAGTGGKTPMLRCRGTLGGDTNVDLELTNAMPNTSAALVVGYSEVSAPFMGGTMVPWPDLIIPGLPVDANGELTLSVPIIPGIPGDIPIWVQMWVMDPAAPSGYSASNGVKGVTP